MEVAQVVQLFDIVGALAFDRGAGDGEQLVRGLSHRGDDDHRPFCLAGTNDAGDSLNRSGRLDGGPAKFHDDHQSSIPSECINSAFRTAAPAAPRIVLWLSTTNL